ncbi:VWA domain-containing protein, partial [Bacteriovoracaceae bacterium]|nr:VWA domain-containing protein [Bacteriovoracaceae bacterium]
IVDGDGDFLEFAPNFVTEGIKVSENGRVKNTEFSETLSQFLQNDTEFRLLNLLLFDFSGSIKPDDKIAIRNAASSFVSLTMSDDSRSTYTKLMYFDGLRELHNFDGGVDLYAHDKELLFDSISAFENTTYDFRATNLNGAFILGVKDINDAIYHVEQRLKIPIVTGNLIIFTDGQEETFSNTFEEALKHVHASNNNANVFVVALNKDIDKEKLKQLAKDGYYEVEDISKLKEKYVEIGEIVVAESQSHFATFVCPTATGGTAHEMKIEVSMEGYESGEHIFKFDGSTKFENCDLPN